jgi:predicted hotdog family 3-hydroxylacyl-ACP dehydratase
MDFSKNSIKQLIPQRPPFLMVDRVISCDEINAQTEFIVVADNILLEDNMLSAPGIIENMAQSCAARMGCVDLLHGEPIKIGYIGDVRDAVIFKLPCSGDVLRTQIRVIEDFANLLLAEICVKVDGETIATARMKVAKIDMIAKLDDC